MATRIALRVALIMVLSHHHCIFVIFCLGGRNVDLTRHHMHVTPFLMMVQKSTAFINCITLYMWQI